MLLKQEQQVGGPDKDQKNLHLFNPGFPDLRGDPKTMSKQNPPPPFRAFDSSLPRCYDNLIIACRSCTIVYFPVKMSGKIKCERGVFWLGF